MFYKLKSSSSQNLTIGVKTVDKKAKKFVTKNVFTTVVSKSGSFPISITFWQRFVGK